ncbi:hypothetical protein F4779DRAFT_105967 [Xylariaceae sp. FL0662B]|nr:hypothetical protein F4779DRAFT_105967 [Xylariaceae sp. FL0662B]
MASITSRIQDAAPRNQRILNVLSETDHAVPALEQQKRYIDDLNRELSDLEKRIGALDKQRAKELKDHEKYRDSVMRRFAYRVSGKTGKFEAKAEKEEREYFAVLQEEHRAKEQEASLKQLREDALGVQRDLEIQAARHNAAQQDLDSLYDSIFQGPTHEFPQEDSVERNSENALQAYHDARVKVETGQQVVRILGDALQRLHSAISYTEDALSHSRMDMLGGGTLSDMMERNALDKAETQVDQMLWFVRQAQRMSPEVQDLPRVAVAHGSIMSDVFFDNIFTDMAFHDKIHETRSALERCRANLQDQLTSARSRLQEAEWTVNARAASLKNSRAELQEAREQIFERIGNDRESEIAKPADDRPTDDPPPY